MRKIILAMFCMLFTVSMARAADAPIVVTGAWVRASLGQSGTTAGYMKIENRGASEDKLLSVAMPSAGMAHLHESTMKDGIMQMKAVDSLVLKPGQSLEMKPGAMHIMVMGLKSALKAGETVRLDLQFEYAGRISVDAEVRAVK